MKRVVAILVLLMLAFAVGASTLPRLTGREWARWNLDEKLQFVTGFMAAFDAMIDIYVDRGATMEYATAVYDLSGSPASVMLDVDLFYAESQSRQKFSIAAVVLVVTGRFSEWEKARGGS